ncbi:cdkn1a interacting zinc finger protein 1b [Neolamprologus brichardi]|uniref:cdkn1a interacting zinc finger protein 1b n=1 Tax=Neolamprologus brichardi TaxID=32507 RepID=UPI001643E310|nr:cdkn1a interacting zinc finger protein 1b [Neolamprologus brichardi]
MVKQPQRTDRCFIPTAGSALARVRFPVCAAQRRPAPPQQASETGSTESWPRCSSTATEEERGADGPSQPGGVEGGSEESDSKRARMEDDVAPPSRVCVIQMCKQLCRPFCPVCGRHFRTPRKFVEHMKSSEHKQQVLLQEAQEEELITVDAVGCFEEEGEEEEEGAVVEEEVDVADEEEDAATKEEVAEEEEDKRRAEYDPSTAYAALSPPGGRSVERKSRRRRSECGFCLVVSLRQTGSDALLSVPTGSSFVVPVCGFMCRLCKKFFYSEAAARHTHCRTRTHYLHLQVHICFLFNDCLHVTGVSAKRAHLWTVTGELMSLQHRRTCAAQSESSELDLKTTQEEGT